MTIAGLDLSISSTGIAVTDDTGNITTRRIQTKATATGPLDKKHKPTQSYMDKLLRFRKVCQGVREFIPAGTHVYLEGPSYSSPGSSGHDIAGNWWRVYDMLIDQCCRVTVVSPSSLKMYATGKGAGPETGKDRVLAQVIKRYPDINVDGNDVADAVTLMAIGRRLSGDPIEDSLPAANLAALKGISATS